MDKRELRKIPALRATPQDISLAKRVSGAKYIAKSEVRICAHKKTLLLNLFRAPELRIGKVEAAFRVCCTHDDYITQDMQNATACKWLTGKLYSITWEYDDYGNGDFITFSDDESVNLVHKFFHKEGDPIRVIHDFQESIAHERLMCRYRELMHQIDERMKLVPSLPHDFRHWVEEYALYDSRYLVYQYSRKKQMDGYCTHCHHDVKVINPKHNQKGICPHCGSHVIFKAAGKFHHQLDREHVTLIQRAGDGFVFRCFTAYKRYDNIRKPDMAIYEDMRSFADKGFQITSEDAYKWDSFRPNVNIVRWKDDPAAGVWYEGKVYWNNLQEVLQGTKCQYSALWTLLERNPDKRFYPLGFLLNYKPSYEYLIKLGMYNLVFEDVNSSEYLYSNNGTDIPKESKSIVEALGIPKTMLSMLKMMNPTKNELSMFRAAAAAGKWTTPEEVRRVESVIPDARVFSVPETTPHKIMRYIEQQKGRNAEHAFREWIDYIGFCRKLGYDMGNSFILFPKELKKSHDTLMNRIKIKNSRAEDKKIRAMFKEYQRRFEWQQGNYVMLVPRCAADIIKEGQDQHNCVGGYVKSVAEKATVVLFLRKKENPKKSLYTVEYCDGKVMQCRSFSNGPMTSEVEKLIKQFERDILCRAEKEKIGVGVA
ncbi:MULTISPECIES: PcfJ domain-containing protein [Caproicibacterium]|uniref:PcfJ domain-containing protein n=1 Tax=Caproicibacterium argilliputei TaxID=3030016 RepID=A0AA97DDE0_9FIRM|nr:PcfJ domain-containing protein [Caproicibacterium argilliputei]WOC33443.1 PcfJ domain-containing protein [Caproicibacterium argilliputei]